MSKHKASSQASCKNTSKTFVQNLDTTRGNDQSTSATAPENLDFEQALQQLETTVQAMQQGELNLERSLAQFTQGVKLIHACQQKLQVAKQQVETFMQQDQMLQKNPAHHQQATGSGASDNNSDHDKTS